jgi:hypothetical protein
MMPVSAACMKEMVKKIYKARQACSIILTVWEVEIGRTTV